ncbi:hypothetical protein EBZ80_05310 [bacterium]|nr:hypothetical protein [bacterium]
MSSCVPTLRGIIKKARNSGYDLRTSLFEFLDNALDAGSTMIRVAIREKNDHGVPRISRILISDNNEAGIARDRLQQIFSWTYDRERSAQNDIGEYGTGFKCAAVNMGNKLVLLTRDGETGVCWRAVADWDRMEDKDRFYPDVTEIFSSDYREDHPFETGSTFVMESLRNEFFFQSREGVSLVTRLHADIRYHYRYYLSARPETTFEVTDGTRTFVLTDGTDTRLFAAPEELTLEDKVLAYKDQAGFMNYFFQRRGSSVLEWVEFVEKRKNGNSHLRVSEVSPRCLASMRPVDTLVFRSVAYEDASVPRDDQTPSYGTIDIVENHRVMGRDMTFRRPRHDDLAAFIKHEVFCSSKRLNPVLGIQFNKRSVPVENDLRYTLEYLQTAHERELVRLLHHHPKKEELGGVVLIVEEAAPPPIVAEPPVVEKTRAVSVEDRRKNFTLETKLQILKKQVCRDQDLDFLLRDDVLPFDYDHKSRRTDNSVENGQALSVISHALKTRRPETYQKILNNREDYLIDLLNCITSSRFFLDMYTTGKIRVLPPEMSSLQSGIFAKKI